METKFNDQLLKFVPFYIETGPFFMFTGFLGVRRVTIFEVKATNSSRSIIIYLYICITNVTFVFLAEFVSQLPINKHDHDADIVLLIATKFGICNQ